LFVQYNSTEDYSYAAPDTNGDTRDVTLGEAQFRVWRRAATERTSITSDVLSSIVNGTAYSFTIKESVPGQVALSSEVTVSFTGLSSVPLNGNAIAGAINAAGLLNVEASFDENSGKITIVHKRAGDIRFTDGTNNPIGTMFGDGFNPYTKAGTANFYAAPVGALEDYIASSWKPLASEGFIAAGTTPLNEAQDGQLWYNPAFGEVDIMVHNGNTWVGYKDTTSPY